MENHMLLITKRSRWILLDNYPVPPTSDSRVTGFLHSGISLWPPQLTEEQKVK